LPLTTPKGIEVGVDAADVNLQVSILVEAQASPGSAISVVL